VVAEGREQLHVDTASFKSTKIALKDQGVNTFMLTLESVLFFSGVGGHGDERRVLLRGLKLLLAVGRRLSALERRPS